MPTHNAQLKKIKLKIKHHVNRQIFDLSKVTINAL